MKELRGGNVGESPENRLRRLGMRSWRRGMKEMDIILGRFSDKNLKRLSTQELDAYEDLLGENDQDLYDWVSGRRFVPEHTRIMVTRIQNSISE